MCQAKVEDKTTLNASEWLPFSNSWSTHRLLQLETMDPKLTHVFTLRAHVSQDSVHLGSHPTGSQKHITALESGTFNGVPNTRGEGMDATLVPGGSDWVLFDPATNVVQIDVRTQGKLSDGSGMSVQYTGYMVVDEKAKRFMGRGPDARSTGFADHHWWTRPLIETSGRWDASWLLFRVSRINELIRPFSISVQVDRIHSICGP